MNTVLIHGFWGSPQDWNQVVRRLPLGWRIWVPDLYQRGSLAPHHSLAEWTAHFLEELHMQFGASPVQLVGYSMGGRLALQALLAEPKRFQRALLLSARPTMPLPEARERESWEKNWARRFQTEDWDHLARDWQQLEIFKGSPPLYRRGDPVLREMLAQSLINWSPRHHADLADRVAELPSGVDWAFGALDQKYMEVSKWLRERPVQGEIVHIPQAGHRLIIEAVDDVVNWLTKAGSRK